MGKHEARTVQAPQATQTAHSWRATVRTIFAAIVAFSAMWALIVAELGLDPSVEWVAASIGVTGAITKLMALRSVDQFIRRFLPWLSPDDGEGNEAYEPVEAPVEVVSFHGDGSTHVIG